jgi:predicted N-formylglutamate amidohydrolase
MTKQGPVEAGAVALAEPCPDSHELLDGDLDCGLLILADHATNFIPPEYGDLGLSKAALQRHIACDIGVGPLARDLAERFRAPAVLTTFSRLLIDPNRGEDDPTLIMRLSDGTIVPGNLDVDAGEREWRLNRFYRPYHAAVERLIDAMLATGQVPAILSIHSYTPVWKGEKRPWHAGILWDRDPRFSRALLKRLRAEHGLRVGDNEPYSGALKHDSMYRHGSGRGLAHALLEVRNDLIEKPAGVLEWADRLEPLLREILEDQTLHEIRRYGSTADENRRDADEGDDDAANGQRYAHGA